jgi:hypothetical protein
LLPLSVTSVFSVARFFGFVRAFASFRLTAKALLDPLRGQFFCF